MTKTEIEGELDLLRKQVAQYEAWFRAIDKNSKFDFWFKNAESQYTYVNPHFAENMGHEVCNLQNVHPENIFDKDRVERIKALDKQVMDDRYLKRVIPCNASGRLQMHEEHRFAVTDEADNPIGLGCFAFEVTEKSLAEETLHQAEKIANLCSWRWSAETNLLISCSEQMAEFLGIEITDAFKVFPNRAQTLVLQEDRHVFKAVEDRITGLSNDGYEIEYRLCRTDGQIIHVRETAEPFSPSENVVEYLGVMQDITHQKIAETALKKSNETLELKVQKRTKELSTAKEKAEAANKAKSQFLATMSHELRTPMNGVLGMTQILQQTKLNEKQMELLGTIHSSGFALVTILNDILDFSKIEAGLLELELEPFNLSDAVNDVVSLLISSANEKGLNLKVKIHSNLPEHIIGDVGRIRQVLLNLVGNAIKFTSKGHVLIEVNSHVEGDSARISMKVSDTGIGIAEDKLDLVFNEFTQAEQSITRQFGGTGLGLSITRNIVQAMPDGKISVTSELNKGTTFTVDLNLKIALSETSQSEISNAPNFNNEIALIVTGNEARHKFLKETLQSWGLKPIFSTHAKQALSVLRQAKIKDINIKLVITDYDLGQYTGVNLFQAIKTSKKISDIKTVLVSSQKYSDIPDNIEGLRIIESEAPNIAAASLKQAICDSLQAAPVSKIKKAAQKLKSENTALGSSTPKHSILVVDDNQINQDVLLHMLDENQFNIDTAVNGQEACQMSQLKEYDLIFMDISMPVMGGIEATQEIQKYNRRHGYPNIPIIAVTAHVMQEDRKQFIEQGMTDYLAKPVGYADVNAMLQKYLDVPPMRETKISA